MTDNYKHMVFWWGKSIKISSNMNLGVLWLCLMRGNILNPWEGPRELCPTYPCQFCSPPLGRPPPSCLCLTSWGDPSFVAYSLTTVSVAHMEVFSPRMLVCKIWKCFPATQQIVTILKPLWAPTTLDIQENFMESSRLSHDPENKKLTPWHIWVSLGPCSSITILHVSYQLLIFIVFQLIQCPVFYGFPPI